MNETPMQLGLGLALIIILILTACGGGGPEDPGGGQQIDEPPAAPTNVTATPGPGYITVSWQDNSDNETGFTIYRSSANESSVTVLQVGEEIGTVGENETEFNDLDIELGEEYSYGVGAKGSGDEDSEPATQDTPPAKVDASVDLLVGTNNRRHSDTENGTIFIGYLVFPEDVLADESVDFDVTISGPDGWHESEGGALNYVLPPEAVARKDGFTFVSRNDITAVNGEYELSVVIGDETYQATATLDDASYKFPRPTDMTVSDANSAGATVSWTWPDGALSAFVSMWLGEYDTRVAGHAVATESPHSFDGLELEEGLYQFEVAALNVDLSSYPVKTEPFGISYDTVPFAVGDVLSVECASPDESVDIPDDALEQAVRDELGVMTGDITCADMAGLQRLEAEDAGIESVEGLQYATGLEDLVLNENSVQDIGPLADLTALQVLELNQNQVSDLTPVKGLTNLEILALCCESNGYTDISAVAELTNLIELDVGGHGLDDISALEDLNALRYVWLWGNDLDSADMGILADNDLYKLEIRGNMLDDLGFLADHPSLESLDLESNPISDPVGQLTAQMPGLSALTELTLANLEIDEISFLETVTTLVFLDLSQNQIYDISPLIPLTELTHLDVFDNHLTDIADLVANEVLGDGDYLRVHDNYLEIYDDSPDELDIQTLLDAGVEVDYEPQWQGGGCAVELMGEPATEVRSVDPVGTFLATHTDDTSSPPTSIQLSDIGLSPGDCIGLESAGAYRGGPGEEEVENDMLAVFSDGTGFIAAVNMPDAITFTCEEPEGDNDISQDFPIDEIAYAEIPVGTTEILVGPFDCYFADNEDSDDDYKVVISY